MYTININDTILENQYFRLMRYKKVNWPVHVHYSFEIVYVKSGLLKMTVNDELFYVKKGEIITILPFEKHSFETPVYCECCVIEFSPELVSEYYQLIKNKKLLNPVCLPNENVMRMCDEFLPNDVYYYNDLNKLTAKAFLYPICAEVYKLCSFTACETRFDKACVEAMKFVSDNLSGDVSLSTTAKNIGVHPAYLSKIFKQSCKITFTEYVNSYRCSVAMHILKTETDKTISEISYQTGFGSIRNFNREFKKLYKVTPSAVLKNTQK